MLRLRPRANRTLSAWDGYGLTNLEQIRYPRYIYIYMCVCHNIYSNFFEYHNFTVSTSPTFIDGTGYVVAMKASVANEVAQAPHVQA